MRRLSVVQSSTLVGLHYSHASVTTTTTATTKTRGLSAAAAVLEQPSSDAASSAPAGTRSQRGLTTTRRNSSEESRRTTVKLWSVLEEAEGGAKRKSARREVVKGSEDDLKATSLSSDAAAGDQLIEAVQTSPTVAALDKRWRSALVNDALSVQDKQRALVARSLAMSKIASGSELDRVLGAMNRVLRNPSIREPVTKPEYVSVVNQAAKAFVRAGDGSRALELVQSLRQDQGKLFPNRTSYALAIAGVLLPPKVKQLPVKKAMEASPTTAAAPDAALEKSKQSALRTALVYFRSLFSASSPSSSSTATAVTSMSEPIAEVKTTSSEGESSPEDEHLTETSSQRPSVFSVLSMLKEDFNAGNSDANLTQDLFDDLLVIAPRMSAEVAEVMAKSGFQPTPTSFLAMLHAAMKAGDAQKALNLLSAMLEQNIERDHVHYVAVASALAAKAVTDHRRRLLASSGGGVKPWYFKALVDGYLKDFGGVDAELASIVVKGLCRTKSGDQELVPVLEEFLATFSNATIGMDTEAFSAMIDRLSVTNGKENVRKITEWMRRTTTIKARDGRLNAAYLKFYAEQLVKLHRSISRSLSATTGKEQERVAAEAKIRESNETVAIAEKLVAEMLQASSSNKSSRVLQTLQRRSSESSSSSPSAVFDVTKVWPFEDSEELSSINSPVWPLLARVYMHSFNSGRLQQLIADITSDYPDSKDKTSEMDDKKRLVKSLMHILIKSFGMERKVDEAVEVVARMQSEGVELDAETVDLLALEVFARNNRLGEGLAHLLGLCRTYKIRPKGSTAVRMLERAEKDGNREEEQRIREMIKEFKLENELKRVNRPL